AADSAVRTTYARFKRKVEGARGLTPEQVEKVAQGRVWYGDEAHGHRLVDEMGGLEEAIAEARPVANVPAGEELELRTVRRAAAAQPDRASGGHRAARYVGTDAGATRGHGSPAPRPSR